MVYGNYEGKDISDPELRNYFNRDYIVNSNWYKERLALKQQKDIAFYKKLIQYLENFIANPNNSNLIVKMNIKERLDNVKELYKKAKSKTYLESLNGTIVTDPLCKKRENSI